MTRRRGLIVAAVATLAIFIVLFVLDGRMTDAGGPGIVGFEVAGSQDRATEILGEWGDQGIDAARASLWIDYAYIVAYTTLLFLAARATRDLAEARRWRRMAAFGAVAPWLAVAGGAFDAVEDLGLLLALDRHGGDAAPRLAQICASFKFALLAVTTIYLLVGLVLRLRARTA